MDEGLILDEFLSMTQPDRIETKRITGKTQLLNILEDDKFLKAFGCIHLSGHGDSESCTFELAKGSVCPDEFPEGCFEGKTITFSACSLGRKDFMDQFLEQTGATAAIAPVNEVEFVESAMFYVLFYYLVLHLEKSPGGSFDSAREMLDGKVKGGFKYWS
jgi:hypothetical protein